MSRSVRVLHVDDEPRFTGLTTTHLQRVDDRYEVETATSANEGLELLDGGQFDCVVSDYDMPGKNGIEFLEAVRESYPTLPFVLFTGKGSEEVASDAISAGVTDYLQKDTGAEQFELLANRIDNAVSQSRTEHELEQQRTILETLTENLPAGILVEDESREVLAANTRLVQLFGNEVSVGELIGADCARLSRDLKDLFRRSEEFVTSIENCLDAREPVTGETFELVDGRIVERDYVPYELPDGKANLWVYTDVTDDREQARLLTGLFEQSLHGIGIKKIITDEDGEPVDYRYVKVNDRFEELTGLDADEVVGSRATDVIDGIEETGFIETFGDVALGGEPVRFEQYSEPLDRHYEISAFSPREGRFITIFSDITDRKEKERQLKRQNERLDEFASVVSHDLRNPLNVANVRLDLLVEECESDHLEEIEWALDRMDRLIEDVLTLAREGETVGEKDKVALDELVTRCWTGVETSNATLACKTSIEIQADRSRLAQLFENLFRNSAEHNAEPVTITVGELDDGFYIEDDGRGIPEDKHERIFKVGYSSTEDGTGFGLAIVDGIVTAHDWEINVAESDAGGARFEITGVERID